jgi:Protein of unknown function (DUF732)
MMKHVSPAALAALALGAGLAFAAPAHADTQDFLNYMRNHGYANAESYLSQGMQECAALRAGKSQGGPIGQLEHQLRRAESELVVVGAHQYLCPGA